ncbi:TonB-dependent receptor SusC [bioreactor metagenome]|jgi:TonB-linked SusC/RagA family outer membrane protein|uniref:TonB-dependent receptor SusC n=1 Tax=bioreactor metagenome TaxID=1076179 RepID=A0A644VMY6_9ZZZZ|nr:TonB-dependent receptor [Paludibacter sp.]
MKITKNKQKTGAITSDGKYLLRFALILLLVVPMGLSAQKITLTGVVVDTANDPIIGANILIKGTASGTITDFNGAFSIDVAVSDVLVVSYIGMIPQEIAVGNSRNIRVVLTEDTRTLEEVVVIGYGTQKKKDLTTAVSSVSGEEIAERPIISAAQALQGKAAGVQVIQPSGKPGAGLSIRVRGSTSISSSNEPLYVVDGTPTNDISNLNPSDIENMSILKDASSAAIYGSRAANGVVLITTKRGSKGESQISLNSYFGFSKVGKTLSTLNTTQYYDLMDEIYGEGYVDRTNTNFTDWNQEIFGTGYQQNYQLTFSGATDKTNYFVSGGYQKEEGIISPAWYDRLSFRTNLDTEIKSWLHLSSNLNVTRTKRRDATDNTSSGRGGIILSVLNTPPFLEIWDPAHPGQYAVNPFQPSWENPVAQASSYNMNNDYRLMGNVAITIDFTKDLKFKSSFSADFTSHQWDSFIDPVKTGYGRQNNGLGEAARDTYLTWLTEHLLTYDKSWGKHTVSVLAGMTAQEYHHENSYQAVKDFVKGVQNNKEYMTLNWANQITASTTSADEWALVSGLARFHYNWDSRYLATANLRVDASSKLHPNHRTGIFPSFSAGWRISAEEFWGGLADVANDMKLRIGWGKNGNQEGLSSYSYYNLNYVQKVTETGSGPSIKPVSTMGNPDLTWETTTQTNAGIDLSLFNSRIVLALDAYYKKTTDLIRIVYLPETVGRNPVRNSGEIENKGLEFQLTTRNLTGVFKWDTDFNMSFNTNQTMNFDFNKPTFQGFVESNGQTATILKGGYPLGTFYGYIADGVDSETGNMIYRDLNKNNILDAGDRTVIGNPHPKFIYGMTNTLSYKGFTLNFFFQGTYGNDIYNASRIDTEGMFDTKNQSVRVLNRWQRPGMITTIPKASSEGDTQNVLTSTRFIEDGSYLRLKTLTLSYNFDKKLLGSQKIISNVNIYATATNLFTLTNYSGYDPEVNYAGNSGTVLGIDYGTYPQSKSVIFGLNVNF